MQLHAEEAVSAHMANHKKIFNQSRIIKRSFCQHFLCRNSKILNQAEIIKPMGCDEIIR
jgi:hypothetical protein